MEKLVSVLFGIMFSLNCFSQFSDLTIAKAYYTLKHKRDTNNRDSVYTENMELLIGKNASVFKSLDRAWQAESVKKNLDEQSKNWTGVGLPKTKMPSNIRKISTEEIFLFRAEQKMLINEFLIVNYLYEAPFEEINWTLDPETKIFDKISCQKATALFKGRAWEVWFSPDIPLNSGPWKLHGLPGLIIEAYDTKKEIQFLFNGFESVNANNIDQKTKNGISLPSKSVKASLKEINKLKEGMYGDAQNFWKAQLATLRGIVDPGQYAGFSTKKINNPIELSEEK